jgi:hypothetical protein
MKVKIKKINKLEDNNFFYWRVKLKRKINLTKGKTNQKNVGKNGKNNTP